MVARLARPSTAPNDPAFGPKVRTDLAGHSGVMIASAADAPVAPRREHVWALVAELGLRSRVSLLGHRPCPALERHFAAAWA